MYLYIVYIENTSRKPIFSVNNTTTPTVSWKCNFLSFNEVLLKVPDVTIATTETKNVLVIFCIFRMLNAHRKTKHNEDK